MDALDVLIATREEIQVEWEKLDCNIVWALIIGKKPVRKPMGKQSCSKKLRTAAYTYQYWK
jgi:hypothetical protein